MVGFHGVSTEASCPAWLGKSALLAGRAKASLGTDRVRNIGDVSAAIRGFSESVTLDTS
jgi:hypothetical protein